ncbi:MAG: hypothetical protein HYY35_05350 [Deltaproteobacteria bacterium]|nr:hypothetical protein [Deltaproteobacteria bacterium]
MTALVLAALFLPLTHFGISSSRLRDALVRRLGEQPYRGLYSLITLGALVWLVRSYRAAPTELLWVAPAAVRGVAVAMVFVAFLLMVLGATTPNPTTIGAERLLERPDVVRGILRVTRNPFLWGVGLWALAHVAVVGDLAGVVLFASIGALGLIGAPLVDAKKAERHGERWRAFAAATSSVPFLAVAQGRQRLALSEIGWWRVVLAVALFVATLLVHRWAFGVSPL